ncbi:Integrin-linked protein [Vigna angularis]|uniref:Mitochondrial proton/calcium exchanger protein n=1 Tax=Phaseolus angularis TaxID=3914 RepID=A0A8T0LFG9_PHAAN|nr:Integrin-linked protein [Vigna angularis]
MENIAAQLKRGISRQFSSGSLRKSLSRQFTRQASLDPRRNNQRFSFGRQSSLDPIRRSPEHDEAELTVPENLDSTMQLLFMACRGDVKGVEDLLNEGIDVNSIDLDGRTALHIAACEGHAEVARLLLTRKANIDARDRWGSTAAADAKYYGNTEIYYMLKARGAKVPKTRKTPMTVANPREVPEYELNPLELQVRKSDGISKGTYQVAKWNGTKVAVKILDKDSYTDPDTIWPELVFVLFSVLYYSTLALIFHNINNSFRNAFKHELTLLERVRHPNLVQFVGAVTQNVPMMIVREYHAKTDQAKLVQPDTNIDLSSLYVAPEIYKDEVFDRSADAYSFGLIIYEGSSDKESSSNRSSFSKESFGKGSFDKDSSRKDRPVRGRLARDRLATTTPRIPCKHGTAPYRDLCDRFGLGKFGSAVPRDSFSGFNEPIGVRWLTQSAAAKKQEENDDAVAKLRKEASPEECDQAVEGLTTAKAKAMAKRSQESPKEVQSVLRRVWTALLGIGPALRAVASMSRLVPFAVFIIVPFMEFLLPVFLKLFPNMLPSTFQDKMKEQEALKRRLKARIEYARFLQDTVKEMAKEVQNSRSGELKKTAEDLDEFLNMIRRGATVSNEEILGFAKLFNDELTLDNISRPRLVNMCKYMGISPFGTDAYLRYMLRKHLRRSFTVSGKLKPEEAVQATLSSLPDEVVDTIQVTSLPSEDSVSERRRKLEFLEMQEELIKEEEEERQEVVQARMESSSSQVDKALNEMNISTAKEAHQLARDRAVENKEQLCEISRALAVLASASIELYNSMVKKEGSDGPKDAFKAYKAAREEHDITAESGEGDKVSSALINRVDAMLQNLEKEIDDVDAKIGDRWRLLDRDYDGKVTAEEVASAAMYLKDTLGKEGIQELVSNLSKDRDGKILVEDIVKLGSWREDGNVPEDGTRESV